MGQTEKEKLEFFCFDVLGDHVDPKNIRVEQDRKGELRVIVLRSPYVPVSFLQEEWDRQVAGTEYENIPLFLPTGR